MRFCTICRRTVEGDADRCPHDGAPAGPSTPISPGVGTVIKGRFTLEEVVARGATGTLFQAKDSQSGDKVLLKVIHPTLEAAATVKQRLKRELTQNMKLNTPSAARIIDSGEDGHLMYVARTWVDGEPLSSIFLRQGKLDPSLAAQIAYHVCTGLDAAHKIGLIHRDLKPGHVMIQSSASVSTPVLIDFGVTPPIEGVEGVKDLSGTAAYLSPEQAEGKMVSFRSDFYALGVVIYELVTGRPLFSSDSIPKLLEMHRTVEPEPLDRIEPSVPKPLAELVTKLISKKPANRPFSAAMVQRDLVKAFGNAASPLPADLARSHAAPVSQPKPAPVPSEIAMAKTMCGMPGAGKTPSTQPAAAAQMAPISQQIPAAAPAAAEGARTVFGMPGMGVQPAAQTPAAQAVVQAPAHKGVDVKKTVLGMPALVPGQYGIPKGKHEPKPEEAPHPEAKVEAAEKAPETEERPKPRVETQQAAAMAKTEEAEEVPSTRKGIVIGLVIGVAVILILLIVLLLK